MQPMVTPEHAHTKALQDLAQVIQGNNNVKGTRQFDSITKMQELFISNNNIHVPALQQGQTVRFV
jgi:hypothetical protein